jgi:hypothetical protein
MNSVDKYIVLGHAQHKMINMNSDSLFQGNQGLYEVTYVNGDVVEIEACTPAIAQAIAEEDAEMNGQSLSVVSIQLLCQLPTEG